MFQVSTRYMYSATDRLCEIAYHGNTVCIGKSSPSLLIHADVIEDKQDKHLVDILLWEYERNRCKYTLDVNFKYTVKQELVNVCFDLTLSPLYHGT